MQRCQMTYMFEYPEFIKYDIPKLKRNDSFKWYGLYRYNEGGNIDDSLRGIPVLFIPGNSGSYKQVRSLASVSRQISLQKYEHQMFDYFSVDLNEELSGLSGAIVDRQTRYVSLVITYLSGLYQGNAEIVLVGHSMGGIVAQASLMMLERSREASVKVRLIICLASPLAVPVVGVDSRLITIYRRVAEYWLNNPGGDDGVMIVSITGGNRDLLVWYGYGRFAGAENALWVPAGSIKELWSSTDHLCIVWCRQLVVRVVKMLYRLLREPSRLAQSQREFKAAFHSELMAMPSEIQYNNNNNNNKDDSVLSIEDSYLRLLLSTFSFAASAEEGIKYLVFKQTYSVTRPLRLQLISSECTKGVQDSNVVMSYMGLFYKYHISNDNSILLTTPITNFSYYKYHPDMTVGINLTSSNCRNHIISVHASLIDWTAQLIRIHVGRIPCLISSILILNMFKSGPLSLLAMIITIYICLINNLQNTFSFSLAKLYELAIIDIFDLILLLAICLPFCKLLLMISSMLLRIMNIIRNQFCPVGKVPIFQLYSVILFIPSILIMLVVPHIPFLCTLSVLIPYFVVSAINVSKKTSFPQQSSIGGILLVMALLQLPPLIAEWHSIKQHESILNTFRKLIIGSKNPSSYWDSSLFVQPVLFAISSISHADVKASSKLKVLIHSSISAILASGCILFGCIDILQCIPFLVSSLIALKTLNYLMLK